MRPRQYALVGWSRLPLPARVIRLRTAGAFENLEARTFALDVRADFESDEVLLSLDMTLSPDANGIRRVDPAGILPQIDGPTMAAAYAALCAVHGVRAGGDGRGVYDLRSVTEDGFAEVPLEGPFIIKASTTQP